MEKTQLYQNCFGFEKSDQYLQLNENKEKCASQYLNIHKFQRVTTISTQIHPIPHRPLTIFFPDNDYTILKYIFYISKVI